MDTFFSSHKGRQNLHTVHLWENWNMVLGEELALLALPLGIQDRTLIIGAEDNMLMHELSFQLPEILERVNAFMNEEFFTKARLELLQNRTPLYPPQKPVTGASQVREPRIKPENLGSLLPQMNPDSYVGRAYISYVKSFEDE